MLPPVGLNAGVGIAYTGALRIRLEEGCVHTQKHTDTLGHVHTHGTTCVNTYRGTDEHTDTCFYTTIRKLHSIFF